MFSFELPLRVVAVAALVSVCVTPACIRLAWRVGALDRPATALKVQQAPVAYLGGLALVVSMVAALATAGAWLDARVMATLLFAVLVAGIGLADDLLVLTPMTKLIGQIGGSLVLLFAGVKIEAPNAPPFVAEALTVLWLCTSMNAVNIVDVSDGLAPALGIAGAAGALVICALTGDTGGVVLAAALMGALLGFLRFNWPPARIYLGDSGSLLVGGLLGALGFRQSFANGALRPCLCAIALVAVPTFDLGLVIIARVRARVPPHLGSPDHFAVRLRHHGVAPRVIALGALAAGLVVSALACTVHVERELLLPATALTLAAALGALAIILRRYPPPLAAGRDVVVEASPSTEQHQTGYRIREAPPVPTGVAGGAEQEG